MSPISNRLHELTIAVRTFRIRASRSLDRLFVGVRLQADHQYENPLTSGEVYDFREERLAGLRTATLNLEAAIAFLKTGLMLSEAC